LNQELFDKLFVLEQFFTWRIESKIKEDAESQFAAQADQNY
jgi:hypothetical protein